MGDFQAAFTIFISFFIAHALYHTSRFVFVLLLFFLGNVLDLLAIPIFVPFSMLFWSLIIRKRVCWVGGYNAIPVSYQRVA